MNTNFSDRIFLRFSALAQERTPFFADVWKRQEKEFGKPWVIDIAASLNRLFDKNNEAAWENALDGYADFSMEAARHQNFFEEHRRYQRSSSAELLSACYEDKNYMVSTYLPGLFLSHYLWRHHYQLLLFFRNEVLPEINLSGVFYEIGVGSGLYSYETLRYFHNARGKGIDISSYSLDFTKQLLDRSGFLSRYDFEQTDIFRSNLKPESADFVICQEVLEHLEEPGKLCGILSSLTKPGAKAYITAAVNAAHTDHIYLFRSSTEVETMLLANRWKILKSRTEYAYSGKPVEVTPCVAGFLCEKI